MDAPHFTHYEAEDGEVWAHWSDGTFRRVTTAVTAGGRDLEAFEQARVAAKAQRHMIETLGLSNDPSRQDN